MFATLPIYAEIDFYVTLITMTMHKGNPKYNHIKTMKLDDMTETGSIMLDGFLKELRDDDSILLIISATQGLADYEFTITYL
ncbi:MAG: hypothetical protein ACFE9L_13760 [Candidatus Hodarchaeota archaeon]